MNIKKYYEQSRDILLAVSKVAALVAIVYSAYNFADVPSLTLKEIVGVALLELAGVTAVVFVRQGNKSR